MLTTRGYDVETSVVVEGRPLDLVVGGGSAPVAIVCETATWAGPEDYRRGLAHQRRLERRGWTAYRVRESELEIDPARAFATIRRILLEHGIHPRTTHEGAASPAHSAAGEEGRDDRSDPAPAPADPMPRQRRRTGRPRRERGVRA